MPTPNLLAGTAYVTIDGRSHQLVGEFAYRVTQGTRETLKGMDGVHGFKETPEPGMIKGKFRDAGNVSVRELVDATSVVVVAELANGKTIVGRNLWRTGEPVEVDTENAEFTITWEGADVRES